MKIPQLICGIENCKEITRLIAHIDAVICSICGHGKPMHPLCCKQHRNVKHNGAGECRAFYSQLEEMFRKSKSGQK